MRYVTLMRVLALFGLTCGLCLPQPPKGLITFKSEHHGFTVQYPRSWHAEIASDIFAIQNFTSAEAVRGAVLPEGGAGIKILTASQAVRHPQKALSSLDDLVALDTAHETVVAKRTREISDKRHKLTVIEVKTTCCDISPQESVALYFQLDGQMFVGEVSYWRGDSRADLLRDTLDQVVLSVNLSREPA